MYENPQFLTPDGYRRSKIQLLRKKLKENRQGIKHTGTGDFKKDLTSKRSSRQISSKAAKLIAETIRLMMRDN